MINWVNFNGKINTFTKIPLLIVISRVVKLDEIL